MTHLEYSPVLRAGLAARSPVLRFVIDHNPFYLLSAACMLAGLLTLTNSLSFSPIPQQRLVILIATLNLYEAVLIALTVFLVAHQRAAAARDGAMLLGIEALFIADVAWLNSEIFAADLRLGLAINACLLLLAAVKLAVIYRAVFGRPLDGSFWLTLTMLALLFAMPGAFKQISQSRTNATLPAMAIYAAWWAVGALPVLATLLWRQRAISHGELWRHRAAHGNALHADTARRIIGTFIVIAFVSIVAHLALSNWVHKVRWYNANLAPVLLGLAIAVGSYDHHVASLAARARLQLALPVLAILFSVNIPTALSAGSAQQFTPFRAALLGAIIAYLHGFVVHRHVLFAAAAATCFLGACLGSSAGAIVQSLFVPVRVGRATSAKLVPRTGAGWGVLAIVASFVLLALGAAASMLRGRASAQSAPPPPLLASAPRTAGAPLDGEDQLMV